MQYDGHNSYDWMKSFAQFTRDKIISPGAVSTKQLFLAGCMDARNKKLCETGYWNFYDEMLGALNAVDGIQQNCQIEDIVTQECEGYKIMLGSDIGYLRGYLFGK